VRAVAVRPPSAHGSPAEAEPPSPTAAPPEVPASEVPASEAPPPEAGAVFGARLDLAVRYARLLCTVGVERGLIGVREPSRIWSRHLLNGVALADLLRDGDEVVDLGSGAGLPGVPLWLARPGLRLRLVEPMGRRVNFLREVVATLDLDIDVVHARGEDLAHSSADAVVARAVAPLARLIPLALPVLRPSGSLLALKGASAAVEIATAGDALRQWPGARAEQLSVGQGPTRTTVVQVRRPASGKPASRKPASKRGAPR
jgi:16S rRNA (guanine527-N7)-methyltransferase